MNLQEEINEINKRIDALNKDVKTLIDELEGVMENEFPQDGDDYWYIEKLGEVLNDRWEGYSSEIDMLEIGNIYKTKDEAQFALEKIKVEAELRKFSRPFKDNDNNYYIELYQLDKTLSIDSSEYFQTQGTIYFESTTIANEAIDAIGADRIKKYLFGVED